ncbi:MAG: hypothetical protein ABIR19_06365 [Ginsengibacter sp.]
MNIATYYPRLIVFLSIITFLLSCTKTDTLKGLPSIDASSNKTTGSSANDFLSANNYTSVKVEIQFMPGFQPDAASVNNLTGFLKNITNKPVGINVTQQVISSGSKSVYTITDIGALEKSNRNSYNSGKELAVYILVVDGSYSDPNVLGIAFRNTSVCLFGKTIFDNSGGIGQASRTKVLTTVLQHEFGHLLGLVDLGSAMTINHKDVPHGNHCNNQQCLMYYATETTDLLGFLVTGNVPVLDNNCLDDLQSNGGK